MKKCFVLPLLTGAILSFAALPVSADDTNAPANLNRPAVKRELKNLTPEERRARVQELRKRQANQDAARPRDQAQTLTPEEREARIKEFREKHPEVVKQIGGLSAEERRAKIKERMEALQAKKAAGTITPQEERLLERMVGAVKRMESQPIPKTATDKKASENN
jgi:hypothetical protein